MQFHFDSPQYKYHHVGVATYPIAYETLKFIGAFKPDEISSLDIDPYFDKQV
jgi:hypothetical protein